MGHAVRAGSSALTGHPSGSSISATELLGGGIDEPGRALGVFVSPQLLADLHDPSLVISPGYVGPERRRPTPPRLGAVRTLDRPRSRSRSAPTRSLAWRQLLMAVVATVAAVVPLTLIVAHGPQQAAASQPAPATAPRAAATVADARVGRQAAAVQRRTARTEARQAEQATAAARRVDRADRVAQRSQARVAEQARAHAARVAARADRERGVHLHRSTRTAPSTVS